MRFLVGRWIGGHETMGSERVEEIWTSVGQFSLMGMFGWSQNGKPVLYEFVLIEETDSGVVMRMDTRSAGLSGLTEHDRPQVWRLTRCRPREEAVFDSTHGSDRYRITYRLQSPGRLYAQLECTRDGESDIFPYSYEREPFAQDVP